LPDLGVLKSFPPAVWGERTLVFVNGMAANERLGFMGNWRRTGFADHDPEAQPGSWITTLVNNRADRVPRSRVFAEILVHDIRADRHYIIGTNLQGFMSYLESAWAQYAAEYTLWDGDGLEPGDKFLRDARALRIAVSEDQVHARLNAMLGGVGVDVDAAELAGLASDRGLLSARLEQHGKAHLLDDITAHLAGLEEERAACRAFVEELAAAGRRDAQAWDRKAIDLLWRWFRSRVIVIEGAHLSGNAIMERIVKSTPPGYRNTILGCQNIKGPGLDVVYRWQAWETCHRACRELLQGDEAKFEHGLRVLADFQEFGPLCERFIRDTLAAVRTVDIAQSEHCQNQIKLIEQNLDAQLAKASEPVGEAAGESWTERILNGIEAFLDAGDAVRRRKRADRIYRDLVAQRISRARAVVELQALNKRQKGGWLDRAVRSVLPGYFSKDRA
jgi:hypothetical protein